jgi:dTDP-4-amino-4,6-dideoxygalactose transaminase
MKKIIKNKSYRFVWPKINKRIETAVLKQLRKSISIYDGGGIFSDFEKKFAAYHKRRFALLCNSGTNAIHSMFVAADLHPGDEVICPVYTFFATVTPLLFTGAKPVLCDCDENGNIDPKEIAKKITKKTRAIIVTHMWGVPAQMDKISLICKQNGLLLLEDCSHAHGARYKNKVVGSFGDMSAWSLQGPKNITGGEGGIMTTNNRDFFERALLLGHYNKRCLKDINSSSRWYKYATTGMGLKYRAHPLAIAIAIEIFSGIKKNSDYRQKYAQLIIKDLKDNKAVKLPPAYFDKNIKPSWYAFTFLLDDKYPIDKVLEKFYQEGLLDIDNPKSTVPLNLLPLFNKPGDLFPAYKGKNNFSYKKGDFPSAERFFKYLVKLPVGVDREDGALVNRYRQALKKNLISK